MHVILKCPMHRLILYHVQEQSLL